MIQQAKQWTAFHPTPGKFKKKKENPAIPAPYKNGRNKESIVNTL
jgi:hypothetical protein